MPNRLDAEAAAAIFTLPGTDGRFDPKIVAYLNRLGQRRRSVLLAFPPKAAGTFLRSAVAEVLGGHVRRIVHALGGRDAVPSLTAYVFYLLGGRPASPMVAHAHMQALPANQHLIEALDLKPVVMMRSIPDMLCSYLDMLNSEPITPNHWLNAEIPPGFPDFGDAKQADFVIDMMAPWYASYYATWLEYATRSPTRICMLQYVDLRRDPVSTLARLLRHSGLERSHEDCARALSAVWHGRTKYRFNRGEVGRGLKRFTEVHLRRLRTMLSDYYGLDAHLETLLGPMP